DEVVDRLADEQAPGEVRAEQLVAVDDRAASRGEPAGGAGVVEARQDAAHRVDRLGAGDGRHLHAGRGAGEVGVSAEVVVGQDVVPGRHAVVAAEPAAPVVPV